MNTKHGQGGRGTNIIHCHDCGAVIRSRSSNKYLGCIYRCEKCRFLFEEKKRKIIGDIDYWLEKGGADNGQ